MIAREEQGKMEAEMKEVKEELHGHETEAVLEDARQPPEKQRQVEVRERGDSPAASARASPFDAVSATEEPKREVTSVDAKHRGSSLSAEESVVVDNLGESRAAEESSGPTSTEDAPVAGTGKKRAKKGRLWKKNRGKQKSKDPEERQEVDSPFQIEEHIMTTNSATTSTAGVQELDKKPENEVGVSGNGLETQTDLAAESPQVDKHDMKGAEDMDSSMDILDYEEEQKYDIEAGLAAASARPSLEWGLCGEDERGPSGRTPPRTPPLREPRGKNKHGHGREQPPLSHQQSQGPRDPWKRKPSESRGRHEPLRSSSFSHQHTLSAVTIEPQKFEQMSEWNRIKAMQHSAAAEVASHKNWVPRKGIHRVGEGGGDLREHNKGRGKGKQGREQGSQNNHHTKELARQKFEADLKLKQEELLHKSKQALKAEFQKAKRIESIRRGRDELELELERNLVYCDGELIYLNQ